MPNAELAVVVVDEAILALTSYAMSDPLATFYQNRPEGVSSYYGRSNIVLINPADLADQLQSKVVEEAMPMMAAATAMPAPAAEGGMMAMEAMDMARAPGASDSAGSPIAVRTDFNPLAVFAPAVRTDANGQATVDVKLPDNLTRYRVMVVAVAGEQALRLGRGQPDGTPAADGAPRRPRASSTSATASNCPSSCKTRPTKPLQWT